MTTKTAVSAHLSATALLLATSALSLPARADEAQGSVFFHGLRALLSSSATPSQPPGPAPADAAIERRPEADRAAEPAAPQQAPRQKAFVPVLRVGFATGGKGEITGECEGDFSCSDVAAESYDEGDSQLLGADFLWHTSPKLRLGIGAAVVRPVEKAEGRKMALGTEIGLHGVIEGVFPTSDSFALTVRGQIGALVLIPGDDLAKAYEAQRELCRKSSFDTCNTGQGPFIGRSTAVGVGARFAAGDVAFRVEAMGELYSVRASEFEVSDAKVNGTVSTKHDGVRSWLTGGVEL